MKLDPFFSCLLVLTVCWSACHYASIKERVYQRQQENPLYPQTSNIAFWTTIVVAISLLVQATGHRLLKPVAARMLPRGRWEPQVYGLKQSRFAEMSMKAVYFLVLTGTAYNFLHEESWWPVLLGGRGGESALFTDHPFQQSHWFTHWYFYIAAGYHLSCFFSLMMAPKLPDFLETLLLCVCGLLLIIFSYLGNFIRVGSIILFCHDFCDIFSCGCKVFVDTRHKAVTFCLFACLVTSWGYLRLYTFPVAALFPIFKVVKDEEFTAANEGWGFFVFLLLTVFVMNIYWFGLMLKMCLHFCVSGQMSDLHTPVPGAGSFSSTEEGELRTTKDTGASVRSIRSLSTTPSAGGKSSSDWRDGRATTGGNGETTTISSSPDSSRCFGSRLSSPHGTHNSRHATSTYSNEEHSGAYMMITSGNSGELNGSNSAYGSGNSTGSSTPGITNKIRHKSEVTTIPGIPYDGIALCHGDANGILSATTTTTTTTMEDQLDAGNGERHSKEFMKPLRCAAAEAGVNAGMKLPTCT